MIFFFLESGCGNERDLLGKEGFFSTLLFPLFYPDDLDCVWRIHGNKSNLIQLEFKNFNTEINADVLKVSVGWCLIFLMIETRS